MSKPITENCLAEFTAGPSRGAQVWVSCRAPLGLGCSCGCQVWSCEALQPIMGLNVETKQPARVAPGGQLFGSNCCLRRIDPPADDIDTTTDIDQGEVVA